MTQVTSPEQLFVHELQDIYYAEKTLTKVLPQLAQEATDKELQKAFTTSERRTCKVVDQPRSCQRYAAKPRDDEAALVKRMLCLVRQRPRFLIGAGDEAQDAAVDVGDGIGLEQVGHACGCEPTWPDSHDSNIAALSSIGSFCQKASRCASLT